MQAPEETAAHLDAAITAMIYAQSAHRTASEAMSAAREALGRGDAADTGTRDRSARAIKALAAFGEDTLDALETATAGAVAERRSAEAMHAEKSRAALDLAAAEAALKRARSVDEAARAAPAGDGCTIRSSARAGLS